MEEELEQIAGPGEPEELTRQDVALYLRSRKGLYDLLAEVYHREASAELLERLAKTPLPKLDDNSLQARGFDGLRRALRERDANTKRSLSGEYSRLFLGAGVTELHNMASPYESVYLSDEHILMQEPRDQVVKLYRAGRFEVFSDSNEPEDHLSFELTFCAGLMQRAAEAIDAGDDAEAIHSIVLLRQMVEQHLCAWVPQFSHDVRRLAKTGFYRSLALITEGVVLEDAELVAACDAVVNPDAAPFAGIEAAEYDEPLEDEEAEAPEPTLAQKRARADKLFDRMAFMKRPFIKVLEFCLEPRSTDELEAKSSEILRYFKTAYGPAEVRYLLREAFCLETYEVEVEADGDADAEEEPASCDGSADDAGATADDEAAGSDVAPAEEKTVSDDALHSGLAGEAEDAAAAAAAPEAGLAAGDPTIDGLQLVAADDEVGPVKKLMWQTTSIGEEHLEESDPFKAIRDLFAADAAWIEGYQTTLSVIKNGTGAFKEVEAAIKPMDLYQIDNKHASMFLKRLEDAGAIEWRDTWTLTSAGEKTLEDLLAKTVS